MANPNPNPATRFGAESGNKRGKGAKRGSPNAGPRTKSFKAFLANLRESPAAQRSIAAALADPDSRGFAAALRVVSDYDPDKPANKTEITGAEGGPIQLMVIGGKQVKF